ncbi:hypothetical protein KSC_054310 [Ktedonobacter sp. SOSP1-52]|uniref:hypothetical protein n=1 Tax=Ktedonobacter sp. SOSP1-52 TaxID=2778366 RepID=UPI0019162B35|nr:hypothetical protein [Ktedonobacter sp. SOSP1-52]GHO66539.1 hypothetical protein KSC_054310 [Ktedonobacter sp. SOSP1-52]
MLDNMFPFIDPIIELSEDDTAFVIQVDAFFDFLEKTGLDKALNLQKGAKIEVPLDIAMSLLRPDELEKLQKYIASYLRKHNDNEAE